MAYILRSQSGLPAPSGVARNAVAKSRRSDVFFHYGATATPRTAPGEVSTMMGYDRYHRSLGWGGIGYNLLVGPVTGDTYQGRGLDNIGAHATGYNTSGIGICLIGDDSALTSAAKRGLREAYALANSHTGKNLRVYGHRDVASTSCPGDNVYRWIKGGGLSGGSVPSTGGSVPNYNPNGYHSTYVRQVQELLVQRGYSVGSYGIDGILGQDTFDAVKRFQRAMGLEVDGIPGPLTLAALRRGKTPVKQTGTKLVVDRIIGPATVRRLQEILGTTVDGVISSQEAYNKAYLYTWTSLRYENPPRGSRAIIALQKRLGVKADGILGPQTIRAWQAKLKVTVDGYCGPTTAAAIQTALNNGKLW